MKYEYVATTQDGSLIKDIVEANSKNDVADIITQKGLLVVSIHEKKEKKTFKIFKFNHVSHIDRVMFTKHLSVMIRAGLTLNESLQILVDQTESPVLKRVLADVVVNLEEGQKLSNSLERYPRIFNELYVNMVRVGEASGTLEENLEYLAEQMKKDYELISKVKGAMMYPIVVLTATIGLGMGLSIYVLPKIVGLFEGFEGAKLPITTRGLLAFTHVMQKYGVFVVAGMIGSVVLLLWLVRQKAVKPYAHRLYLKMPIVGKIVQNVNLARFCRTLGSLLKSGLVINEALGITARTLGNVLFRFALEDVLVEVEKGSPMSSSMQKYIHLFPPIVTRMANVGERIGNLDGVLLYLSEFYESEVDIATKNLASTIEPILLIVIGCAVGLVAVSIISPIYNLAGSVGK